MADPIRIVHYRQSWPDDFAALAVELAAALGPRALRIDHIGSTSVPGLAAKDVIDVQISVGSLSEPGVLDDAMAACGAEFRAGAVDHRPPGTPVHARELDKRFYAKSGPRRANIHIRVEGRFNQRYALLCRDYLRAHPDAADAYAEIKRQLARRFGNDVEAYYDVKDPVFDLIMAGAREWAASNAWESQFTD